MEMGENLLHFCQNIDEGNDLAGKRVAHFLQMNIPPAVVGDKDPAAFWLTGALHLSSNRVQPFSFFTQLFTPAAANDRSSSSSNWDWARGEEMVE